MLAKKLKTFTLLFALICVVSFLVAIGLFFLTKMNKPLDDKLNLDSEMSKDASFRNYTDIFLEKNYEIVKDLEGTKLPLQKRDIDKGEYLDLIKNSVNISMPSQWSVIGELISQETGEIIIYSLLDLKSPENIPGTVKLKYYKIPSSLSSNVSLVRVNGLKNSYMDSVRWFLFDYNNNLLLVLRTASPGTTENADLQIVKAVKFNDKYSVKDLDVICGYKDIKDHNDKDAPMKTVLNYKGRCLFVIENDTLNVVKSKDTWSWRTLSGYPVEYPDSQKFGFLYLYQYDESNNKIRKLDFFSDKVVYQFDLNKTPIKGKLIMIEKSPDSTYLLTDENGKKRMYETNEKFLNYFRVRENYDNNNAIGNGVDFKLYGTPQRYQIAVLQKEKGDPVAFIDPYSSSWVELRENNLDIGTIGPSPQEVQSIFNGFNEIRISEIWNKLGVESNVFRYTGEPRTIRCFEEDMDGIPGKEVVLQISEDCGTMNRGTQCLIYKNIEGKWRFIGNIDYHDLIQDLKVVSDAENCWLVIAYKSGSGSGFGAYSESWYHIDEYKLRKDLTFIKRVFYTSPGTGHLTKIDGEVNMQEKIDGIFTIEIKYDVESQTPDKLPEKFYNKYYWNSQKNVFDPDPSNLYNEYLK